MTIYGFINSIQCFLFARRRASFFLFLLLFIAIWCGLRVPWIHCDSGIQSVWEYGYNVTDEGYYLSGGKEKFLWGQFVDLARTEAFTYGFSPGTHILSWFAHSLFGLSTWTWRIPFMLINFSAWVALFNFVSKRSRPVFAFLLCVAVSCTPMIVAYERTASNDVLIGSLLVLAYLSGTGRTWRSLVFSALFAASIVMVKPAVYVFLPMVLCGVLSRHKLKNRWMDAGAFAVLSVAFVFLFKGLTCFLVSQDAAAEGVSAMEIVRRTTTHYPLPNLLDITTLLKGLSSFPRHPSGLLLGIWSIVLTVFPLTLFFRRILAGRKTFFWDHRLLLYLMIPAYVAAISIMNTLYTHYFIPVIMMVPVLWTEMRRDLSLGPAHKLRWPGFKLIFILMLSIILGGSVYMLQGAQVDPQKAQAFYSQIYNLPQKNVWFFVWPYALGLSVVLFTVGAALRDSRYSKLSLLGLLFSVCVGASVCLAQLPAVFIAPYIHQSQDAFLATVAINLALASAFILAVISVPQLIASAKYWFLWLPGFVLLGFLLSPHWQTGVSELLRPGTHYQRQVAMELAKTLPKDAIVIGERSNQALMSLPIRTATTFASNSDPIPIIKKSLVKNPDAKLFALIDSQHAYCIQHYEKNKSWCLVEPIKTVKLPSFGNGKLVDVYLCTIHIKKDSVPNLNNNSRSSQP